MTISRLSGFSSPIPQEANYKNAPKSEPGSPAAPATSVTLSPLSAKLKAFSQDGSASQPFDESRVAALRTAIANGQFQVNATVVAEKMIAEAQSLAAGAAR